MQDKKLILLNIIMSSIIFIICLCMLKSYNCQRQFTMNALFKGCGGKAADTSSISQKSFIISNKSSEINQALLRQENPKICDEFISSFKITSHQIIQSSTVEFCPLDFTSGKNLSISLFVDSYQEERPPKIKNFSFSPQQNKCYSIDLLSIDFDTILYGQVIVLRIKSQCQNVLNQQKQNKIKITYKESYVTLFGILQQLIYKIFVTGIIICLIVIVFYSVEGYFIDPQAQIKSNKLNQVETIRQFDVIMPSFMLGDQPNGEVQCSICLLLIKEEQEIRLTPCKHTFHKVCIDRWGVKKLLCPNCRGSLSDKKSNN